MNITFLDHALIALFAVGLPVWAYFGYRSFLKALAAGDGDARRREYRDTVLVQWAVTGVLLVLWFVRGRTWIDLGPDPASQTRFLIAYGLAAAGAVYLVAQWLLLSGSDARLRQVRDAIGSVEPVLPRTDTESRWFAGVSLTAGFCEEVLYRGILFAWAASLIGPWGALLVSSLAFGAGHAYQGATGVLKTGAIGLLFGGLVLLGGSLWPAVLLHAVLDLTSGSLGRRALELPREAEAAAAGA